MAASEYSEPGQPTVPTTERQTIPEGATIASETDLEEFAKLPLDERRLLEPLRGVLAETAVTGIIRYNWSLLRPLVEFTMEQVMLDYDSASQSDIGPSKFSLFQGETVIQTIERFKVLLSSFKHAPWTLQRLCEVLLEPHKQYVKLHKLTLAIERCLLVTSELPPTPQPPPPPLLSELRQVNENPPAVYQSDAAASSRKEGQQEQQQQQQQQQLGASALSSHAIDESAAFTDSLIEVRKGHANSASSSHAHEHHHGGHSHGSNNKAWTANEDDHWPEAGPHGQGLHHQHQHLHHYGQHYAPVKQQQQQQQQHGPSAPPHQAPAESQQPSGANQNVLAPTPSAQQQQQEQQQQPPLSPERDAVHAQEQAPRAVQAVQAVQTVQDASANQGSGPEEVSAAVNTAEPMAIDEAQHTASMDQIVPRPAAADVSATDEGEQRPMEQ